MRNLKRALSMALASVMVLGLTVIGAGAASYEDFTDKDEIVHKDAVSMVTELGVLAGLPDGSFGGSQNIDRASFARLVCVVLNGGKEPILGNLTTDFTDTQGNWAEAYIAFCVNRGIIAGRGDGTFGPSDNVTGSEAAKMLLVALGYNTAYEGIGGATWEVTTNSLANMAGLYEGLETINPSEPLTRDNAAQMIYNALDADMVQYDYTLVTDGTSLSSSPTLEDKTDSNGNTVTLLANYFNAVRLEGVVIANEYANLNTSGSLDEGKTRICVTNYDDQGYDDGDEVEIVVTEVELVEDDTAATYTVTLSGYDADTYSLYLNNRAVEPVENRGSLTVEAEEGDKLTVESSTLTAGATYDVGLSELVTVDSSNGFTVTVDSSLTLSEPVRTAELAGLETDSSADLPVGVTAITAEFESAPDTVQAEDTLTITFALEGEFTGTAEGAVAAEITAEGAEISGDTSVEVISAGGSGLAETEITVTIDEITGNTVTLSVDFS